MKLARLFAFSIATLATGALAIAGCSKPEEPAAPASTSAPAAGGTATAGTPTQGTPSDKPVAEGAGSAQQPQ